MKKRKEMNKVLKTYTLKYRYTLEELIKDITEDNIHKEIKTGKPVGKEIW